MSHRQQPAGQRSDGQHPAGRTVQLPTLVVSIDGPSGSGKSSTARGVAQRLGLRFLDTGAMYRAVAWAALHHGVAGQDDEALMAVAEAVQLTMGTDPDAPSVQLNGHDITRAIREPDVTGYVGNVATVQPIRDLLTDQMRDIIAACRRIVVEGRDITTVVYPQAQVRVLLVADPRVRVRRRETELAGAVEHAVVRQQVVGRDATDATMSQFDTPAPGVTLIDSTELSLTEVIDRVCALVPPELLDPNRSESMAGTPKDLPGGRPVSR